MSWNQLAQLLAKAPLEREIKLMAIDALTLTRDENVKNELIAILLEWQASDQQVSSEFERRLLEIVAETDSQAARSQEAPLLEQTKIADEVGRTAAIEKLKQHIATL